MSHPTIKLIEKYLQDLLSHLARSDRVAKVSEQFSALRSNTERVQFVHALIEGANLFPALVEDFKNDAEAVALRQKGNEMFKTKNNEAALELYTKSIANAEKNSESLAVAYANRSAVLMEEGYFKECLEDIKNALCNGYPSKLKPKLDARKEKCQQLVQSQKATPYHQNIPCIPEEIRNKHIACATNSVEIKDNDDLGRHIVATKDIQLGEVIAVEKPFCHILVGKTSSHCRECLRLCYNLISCQNCTEALYCSKNCKEKANSYHKYECKLLKTFTLLGMDKMKMLPWKIVVIIRDMYDKIRNKDFVEDGIYRSGRYEEIHNLVGNDEKRPVSDMFGRCVTAAIIYHLMKQTSFFTSEDDEEMFQNLLLKHLQTAPCNFHQIFEMVEAEETVEIGAGAYSFLSMFNHSCSPNVVRHCYGTVNVLRAIRTIQAGEQLFDNYGYHHAVEPRESRRSSLRKQYFFDCSCEACEQDWPLYPDLPDLGVVALDCLDLERLRNGDIGYAQEIVGDVLEAARKMEHPQPNKQFAELQEAAKQCFALIGNVRRKNNHLLK
ncbi:unnamed protein product [Callosobruchus maculatus]|uniref:Protein-lysine N-methyltransferase SMYD4 n=1 Tax=Callosobruchus maculatus TaxID=64391 RepID=A0A653BLW9_CALMS|nr:unnamed protein product [Callosobruchus maculatus]